MDDHPFAIRNIVAVFSIAIYLFEREATTLQQKTQLGQKEITQLMRRELTFDRAVAIDFVVYPVNVQHLRPRDRAR